MEISELDDPIRGSLAQNEPQDDVSGCGKSSFLMLWTHSSPYALKILITAPPVDQMDTNDCRHVVNSWSNCKRSKVVTGQAFIDWLNCINFLFLFTLNCSILLHEVLHLLGCVRY